jgi:outer membrane lipoprotein SlyB
VKVPAGTTINVRLTEGIDVDVAQAGMKVRAIVDDPVMFDGRIIIPREARAVLQAVKVTQSGEFKGKDAISLKMNSISFGGRSYQVVTEYATVEGKGESKRTARKVGGGAGLGAIIGGVAGGGSGALIGGVVGGIGGAAVASQGEEHLKLEAETRLQFALSTTVVIQP